MTDSLNLTPEQALGVALSVAAPTMVMGDAQAAAPDMLAHLNAMGYTLATYTEAEDAALDAIEGTHAAHDDEPDPECADCQERAAELWDRMAGQS